MGKNIYSLLLSEELVSRIDGMASKRGLSRSSMLDGILAEYFDTDTPETRMREFFANMEKLIEPHSTMRFCNMASDNMASILSPLPYRYKPTIKYSLELVGDDKYLGRLKVTMRTANGELIYKLDEFFRAYYQVESAFLREDLVCSVGKGGYSRVLFRPQGDAKTQADAVCKYVDMLDRLLSVYFSDENFGIDGIADVYSEFIKNSTVV
ncbi:MAG: ribbon-helix-helix domain-containing protein [Corallococcus sp.]|nr:ribbon-helix-helix domain-containing protein [Corallococcus sp.]